MSANLYETKNPGEYYHIHGSLEASTTLKMIGLEPFRPDLQSHESIVDAIEPAVRKFSVEELESMNAANRQAGVPALKHEDFVKTQHVSTLRSPNLETIKLILQPGQDKHGASTMVGGKPGIRNTQMPFESNFRAADKDLIGYQGA
jgi:hypothetical protein